MEPTLAPSMSAAAVERAARAQLYWNLVQRCRDSAGNILPPDVIRAQFSLDAEGTLVPSSVIVSASDARFSDAARCMQRELTTTPFRVPLSTRGAPKVVSATIPSVD